MKILILAGDLTNFYLSKLLLEKGYNISIEGFNHLTEKPNRKGITVKGYKTIIAPIPFTIDNSTLYSPYSDENIHIDELLSKADLDAKIIGGPFNFKDDRLYDITKNKIFLGLNVIPTCEELIKIMIENSDITINSSNIHIIGNGSINKKLTTLLNALGATIIDLEDISKADIIINTSKSYKFPNELILNLKKSVIIIDISPNENIIDKKLTKQLGINIIKARGLPGKSAPESVSNYIYNTLIALKLI